MHTALNMTFKAKPRRTDLFPDVPAARLDLVAAFGLMLVVSCCQRWAVSVG